MPFNGLARAAGLAALALGLWPLQALAAVEAPAFKVGDHWVYREIAERAPAGFRESIIDVVVTRVSDKYIEIQTKQPDSEIPPVTRMVPADWSRERSINGVMTTVNRPLDFPLVEGKRWDVDYTEPGPTKLVKSQTFHQHYKVTGWEDVKTPAGVYHALKIECDGEWNKETAPAQVAGTMTERDAGGVSGGLVNRTIAAQASTGRFYKAIWYVPEVKRFVKSTEEFYSSTGVRSESFSSLLQSYAPAP
jgi:hypothetical protein